MPRLSSSAAWSVELPPLGFGCCPMGGFGWGRMEEAELIRAVEVALDLGVRLFDTADIYGFGTSESVLGRAVKGRRDQAVIATKFGVRSHHGRSFYDTSVEWIRVALDASLRRLGVDCIDLYQMHYWDGKTALDDIVATLESLMAAGKIRAYGVTNHDPRDSSFSRRTTAPASYSYHFSLVHREREAEILTLQNQGGPVFLSWGSLGQGVLSGNYRSLDQLEPDDRRRRAVYQNFHGDRFSAIQVLLAEMRKLAIESGGRSLTQLALRWIVDRVPRAIPLVGIKRPEQIRDAAEILRFHLEPAICERLNECAARSLTPPASP